MTMKVKMTMRKKIILFFLCLVAIPILIIYIVASNLFIKSAQKDLKNLYAANINEVGKNIDVFFSDALDLTLYPLMEQNLRTFLTEPPSSPSYLKDKKNASDILLSMPYGFSSGIHGITLANMVPDMIGVGSNIRLTNEDTEAAKEQNASPSWDYSAAREKNGYLYLTRLLKNPSNISQHIGYIKLSISCAKIKAAIAENQKDDQTSYFLLSPGNGCLVESDTSRQSDFPKEELSYQKLSQLAASAENSKIISNRILSAYSIEHTDLIIYSITRPDVLTVVKKTFLSNMMILSVLVFAFSILLSLAFAKIITKPMDMLGRRMASLSNEDFSVRVPVKGTDEISVLSHHFNEMAERLEFLYKEVYMGELKLKQSQLDMLQTQINPHFLYNTLDTIYWMAQMGDTQNVSTMVSNMSKMMRLTLTPKTNDKIPLSQELEHLSCYITIQQIRYGSKVQFFQTCPENLMDEYVLSFLLQPLVENALVHGLKNSLHGFVRVTIYEENGNIIYEVANTGELICPDEISAILADPTDSQKGLALKNIRERLRLKYGEAYPMEYYVEKECSVFKITQPKESTI